MKRRWKRTTFKQLLDEMRPLSPIAEMVKKGILPIHPGSNLWGQWPSGPNTWEKGWDTVQDKTVRPDHVKPLEPGKLYSFVEGHGYVLKAIPPGLPPPMPGSGFAHDQFYKAMKNAAYAKAYGADQWTLAHLAKMESKLFQDDKDFHAATPSSSAAVLSYKDWQTLDAFDIDTFDQVVSSLLLGFHSVFPRARAYRPRGTCEHCDDRRLWGLGTMLTYRGSICSSCVQYAFDRGVTLQRIVNRSRSFLCKRIVE